MRRKFGFQGSNFLGSGFLVSAEEAADMIKRSSKESKVIKPFLNGEDLNSRASRESIRWIIDMGLRSEDEAREFRNSWKHIEIAVKPERLKKDATKYPKMVESWWQHWNSRPDLYNQLENLDSCVALSIVSKLMIPAQIELPRVFSHAVAVFADDSNSIFALMSSWAHRSWAQWWGSKMRNDYRYAISDCFDTFPFPKKIQGLEKLGKSLDESQRAIALERDIGLTKLYTLVNAPSCKDADIVKLRGVHEQIDREVMKAFGFDIELGEFEIAEFKGQAQWGPPASQRIEILQLLLAENKRQQVEGVIEWPTK
jgi:hypothetical protein